MPWQLHVARQVEKKLRRLTPKDQRLLVGAIDRLRTDPLACSLEELKGAFSGFRMRVGNWRLTALLVMRRAGWFVLPLLL
jgi:mRNA-degrading endonuclease RelE of RelBE toxin-antitoxin system